MKKSINITVSLFLFLFFIIGVFGLKAENVNDPFYEKRILYIQSNISGEEILGYSFAYDIQPEQCFNIVSNGKMENSNYLNCKIFIDDIYYMDSNN
jgi:hypothetical protein